MLIVLELLIVAIIGGAIQTISLKKINNKELLYTVAYIAGVIATMCIFFIFEVSN